MPDFQRMFMESRGQPVDYEGRLIHMADRLAVARKQIIVVAFDAVNSDWRQGIHLSTTGTFHVNGQKIKRSLVLWQDTAPAEVEVVVESTDCTCLVKNVWDTGDGVMHSWHAGGAMLISDGEHGRVYQCNDGLADDDFDDLVFRLCLID